MRWVGSAILVLAACPMACQAQSVGAGSLPPPLVTENSLEICLNSPLTVRFFALGADAASPAAYEFELTTARSPDGESAVCTASGVAPGTYDITVVGGSTLANLKRNVVISLPATSVDLGTLLEGNLNADDAVDLGDYAVLSRHWLLSKPQAEYDVRADFDRSGLIDAADLALLAANWLWASPLEIGP